MGSHSAVASTSRLPPAPHAQCKREDLSDRDAEPHADAQSTWEETHKLKVSGR